MLPRTWPRVIQEGAETLTMYQPQIEQWDDTSITFRAAVSVQSATDAEPVYGMMRATAQAEVDKMKDWPTKEDMEGTHEEGRDTL